MTAREDILGRLKDKARPEPPPAAWRSRRQYTDLAGSFIEALTGAEGEVLRAENLEQALEQLGWLLEDLQARRVVVNDEAPLSDIDLSSRWPALDWHIAARTPGDLCEFCAAADVGLSGANAALAETGSVIIESGAGRSRLSTLLPPVHIALVSTSLLTADILTWAAARQGASLPASLTLISGPSKTADIEQTLSIGVHGPKRLIVLLYD
jgi:L-lactate utilization protein LutC